MSIVLKILNSLLVLCLLLAIAGCGLSIYPLSFTLIEKAIYKQFSPTQTMISGQLDLTLKGFQVQNVQLQELEKLWIDNLPSFHVKGSYTLKVNLPQRKYEEKNHPFDVYIQRQREGKSWRLAVPDDETLHSWRTYLLE